MGIRQLREALTKTVISMEIEKVLGTMKARERFLLLVKAVQLRIGKAGIHLVNTEDEPFVRQDDRHLWWEVHTWLCLQESQSVWELEAHLVTRGVEHCVCLFRRRYRETWEEACWFPHNRSENRRNKHPSFFLRTLENSSYLEHPLQVVSMGERTQPQTSREPVAWETAWKREANLGFFL